MTLSLGEAAPAVLADQLGYQPFGPLNRLTWGNGLTLTRTFDQSYRLTGQQVGAWSSDYAFDANGNITGLDQSLWGSLQYDYDALDRLTLEQKTSEKTTYVYDATGNRTARVTYSLANGVETQTAKQSLKYNSNRNRLSQRSTSYAVEVDIAGNYTRYSQNRRYTYDEQGRLKTVTDADGGLLASYRYNALGQRVLKTLANGASWTFLYGPDGQLLGQEQYSATTGRKLKGQYWVWLDAMPLAGLELSFNSTGAVSSSTLYYLHADHLNTPRLASNQSQALIWSWNSDAFGVGAANQDVDGNGIATDIPLRFPGQQYDAHSALHYNYFRDYDPETGRYVESDPIGLAGGLNTYVYVEGNPIARIDIYGLENMNLSNPKKDHVINNAYKNDADKPGVLIVYAHGNESQVHDDSQGSRESLNAEQLADKIRSSDQYDPNMPVELRVCNTGAGPAPIAQGLANILGGTVTAPDTFYYYNLDGSVGPRNIDWFRRPTTPGSMNSFGPQR